MHIESYDYISGQSLGSISLSFGDLIQNQHSVKPLVVRFQADPSDSTDISNVRLQLQSRGWSDAEYSYYTSPSFGRLESGCLAMTPFTDRTVSLNWNGSHTDYVWLDAKIKTVVGMSQAGFKLLYDIP